MTWGRTRAAVLLAALTSLLAFSAAPADAGHHPHHGRHAAPRHPARGVATWKVADESRALKRSRASWCYDWGLTPSFKLPAGTSFVPMVWGTAAESGLATGLAAARQYGPDLLTFNEPDRSDQADLSVEQALDAWPALEATGMRLGSPAVASNAPVPGSWLDQFLAGAAARGYRVDFVAVHWYGSDFGARTATRELRHYLAAVHRRYGRPVWLTEYALFDFARAGHHYASPQQQAAFIRRSTRMLDRLPWLERYAWFALPAPSAGRTTGLVRPHGALTAAGRAYRR